MKRRFFVHFEISEACMQAGIRDGDGGRDVFDNLADKMRSNGDVCAMLRLVESGEIDKVVIGVGREFEDPVT